MGLRFACCGIMRKEDVEELFDDYKDDFELIVCDEVNYTFSSKYQQCVGLVNSVCTNITTGEKLLCVDNAFCTIKEHGVGYCECSASYSATKARTCQLKYGFPCVVQNNDHLCNKEQLLNCIRDKCTCIFENLMMFDKEFQQCRMLDGQSCHPQSDLPPESRNSSLWNFYNANNMVIQLACLTGSTCIPRDPTGQGGLGICHRTVNESTTTSETTTTTTPSTINSTTLNQFLAKDKELRLYKKKKKPPFKIKTSTSTTKPSLTISSTSTSSEFPTRDPHRTIEEEDPNLSPVISSSRILTSTSQYCCFLLIIIIILL